MGRGSLVPRWSGRRSVPVDGPRQTHGDDRPTLQPSIDYSLGLGNEDDWPGEYPDLNQSAIRDFKQQLNELAHQLDPSRSTSFRRCDFARDIPDVYSPSIWAGW